MFGRYFVAFSIYLQPKKHLKTMHLVSWRLFTTFGASNTNMPNFGALESSPNAKL